MRDHRLVTLPQLDLIRKPRLRNRPRLLHQREPPLVLLGAPVRDLEPLALVRDEQALVRNLLLLRFDDGHAFRGGEGSCVAVGGRGGGRLLVGCARFLGWWTGGGAVDFVAFQEVGRVDFFGRLWHLRRRHRWRDEWRGGTAIRELVCGGRRRVPLGVVCASLLLLGLLLVHLRMMACERTCRLRRRAHWRRMDRWSHGGEAGDMML